MPLRKIPNIGGMTETTLNAMGFKTCLDLRDRASDLLIAFNERMYKFLISCALGLGVTKHTEDEMLDEQKGISVSETFRPLKLKI